MGDPEDRVIEQPAISDFDMASDAPTALDFAEMMSRIQDATEKIESLRSELRTLRDETFKMGMEVASHKSDNDVRSDMENALVLSAEEGSVNVDHQDVFGRLDDADDGHFAEPFDIVDLNDDSFTIQGGMGELEWLTRIGGREVRAEAGEADPWHEEGMWWIGASSVWSSGTISESQYVWLELDDRTIGHPQVTICMSPNIPDPSGLKYAAGVEVSPLYYIAWNGTAGKINPMACVDARRHHRVSRLG